MSGSTTATVARRGLRQWLVDTGLFLFAAFFGLLMAADRLDSPPVTVPMWLFGLDQILGVVACVALFWRSRRPVELAVALILLSTFAELVAGALLVALFTVAVHRPLRTVMPVFVLTVLSTVVYAQLRPEPDVPALVLLLLGIAMSAAAIGWGLVVQNRRQLVASLKDRAARAEAEARLRAEQAQHEARDALAREIHDVLGHRLSLLSVHAGALQFNPDASAADVARAADVIRENAHQALQDLREVIGVLRAPVGELPQPTLADVDELVAESRRAGMDVRLEEDVTGTVPDTPGRTAYRVVQEGLTNARKHAPGAAVSVSVAGAAAAGLTVEVANTAPAASPEPAGLPGQGLIGLAERAALTGGRLEHGATDGGGWRLSAWLPWPP
jgi:signal transduction histidine kinase